MVCERTLKCLGQAGSKRRAFLFLVSKQNLNASSWRISLTKQFQKWIRNEKVIPHPQVEGVKNSEKETIEHSKADFRASQKFFVCCFVAITARG
jgi:hypothetical protein